MDAQLYLVRSTALIRGASAHLAVDNAEASLVEATREERSALLAAAEAAEEEREASEQCGVDAPPLVLAIAAQARGRLLQALCAVHAANRRRIQAEAALAAAKRNPDYQ